MFENHIYDKELNPEYIFKKSYNLMSKTSLIEKWAEDLNRLVSRGEGVQGMEGERD